MRNEVKDIAETRWERLRRRTDVSRTARVWRSSIVAGTGLFKKRWRKGGREQGAGTGEVGLAVERAAVRPGASPLPLLPLTP